MEVPIVLAVILVALSGFILAYYIHQKKLSAQKTICPLGFNCNAVIHSGYSRFLGIPVEILGMLYYDSVAIIYLALLLMPQLMPVYTTLFVLVLTVIAFFFSLYLAFVQIFKLKEGCTLCLLSTSFCIIIFILASINSLF